MSSSEINLKLPYTKLTKIENEQNWRLARLLIGLSVGILAFSIQTFESNTNYSDIIYFSWILLFMSFCFGLLNLHLFQRVLSNISTKAFEEAKAKEEAEDTMKKVIEEITDKYGKKRKIIERINWWASVFFKGSFIIGILAFAIFKYSVVTSSDPLGKVQDEGNKMAEIISNQEILALNILEIQAQIKILENKGITDKDEILEEVKKLQVEMEEKITKMGKEN